MDRNSTPDLESNGFGYTEMKISSSIEGRKCVIAGTFQKSDHLDHAKIVGKS